MKYLIKSIIFLIILVFINILYFHMKKKIDYILVDCSLLNSNGKLIKNYSATKCSLDPSAMLYIYNEGLLSKSNLDEKKIWSKKIDNLDQIWIVSDQTGYISGTEIKSLDGFNINFQWIKKINLKSGDVEAEFHFFDHLEEMINLIPDQTFYIFEDFAEFKKNNFKNKITERRISFLKFDQLISFQDNAVANENPAFLNGNIALCFEYASGIFILDQNLTKIETVVSIPNISNKNIFDLKLNRFGEFVFFLNESNLYNRFIWNPKTNLLSRDFSIPEDAQLVNFTSLKSQEDYGFITKENENQILSIFRKILFINQEIKIPIQQNIKDNRIQIL